uniref:Uncharacterized protein n=1 Tax=Arundo donax TaxID=35708 RepID=A0A0A9GY89_ARUDO
MYTTSSIQIAWDSRALILPILQRMFDAHLNKFLDHLRLSFGASSNASTLEEMIKARSFYLELVCTC